MKNNRKSRQKATLFYLTLVAFTTLLIFIVVRAVIRKANFGFTWWFEDICSCDTLYLLFVLPSLVSAMRIKDNTKELCQRGIKEYLSRQYFFYVGWNCLSLLCIAPIIIHWGFNPFYLIAVFLYTVGLHNLCILPIALYRIYPKKTVSNIILLCLKAIAPWCIYESFQLTLLSSGSIALILSTIGLSALISAKFVIKRMI